MWARINQKEAPSSRHAKKEAFQLLYETQASLKRKETKYW